MSKEEGGNEEMIQLLKDEISSLQKRLETPSAEAVEWRLAYEHLKEELGRAQNLDYNDDEMEEKNDELEARVERLCTEKLELEDRVSEMIRSSNETRTEIDSMINEVVRLDNNMKSLEDQLANEKTRSREYQSQANETGSKLEDVKAELNRVNDEKTNFEFEINVLKTKLDSAEKTVDQLNSILKEKQAEIIEMETLSRENELDLQCTIEELENKILKSKTEMDQITSSEVELRDRLNETTTGNELLAINLSDAQKKVEEQQSAISALEEKVLHLTNTKDSAALAVKTYEDSEAELNRRIESMSADLDQAQKERENLEQRLTCVKEQAELTTLTLEEKVASIHVFQNQIMQLKDDHAEEMKLTKTEKQAMDRKLSEFKTIHEDVQELKSELETKHQQILDTNEKLQTASQQLEDGIKVKDKLERCLEDADSKCKKLNTELSQLQDVLTQKESSLIDLNKKKDAFENDTIRGFKESEAKLQEEIGRLEAEQSKHLAQIKAIQLEVEQKNFEVLTNKQKIETNNDEISDLRTKNSLLENEKKNQVIKIKSQLTEMEEKLASVRCAKEKIDETMRKSKKELEEKESEIAKLRAERDSVHTLMEDKKASFISLEKSHKLQVQKLLNDKDVLQREINDWKTRVDKSSAYQKELESRRNELESKIKDSEGISRKQLEELQSKLNEKDALIKRNDNEHETLLENKDIELSNLEKSVSSLKAEHSHLIKQYKETVEASAETKRKLLLQQDRVVLLRREKGNLEFELDNLREDQDSLNDQVRVLAKQNKSLHLENENLKRTIENMKNENHIRGSVSKASTFDNDSNISYDNLTTEMDSLIGKMSSHETESVGESPEEDCSPMDETFDESMFLPNVELAPPSEMDGKENTDMRIPSTPLKSDYGEKRQPLTDRKQVRTPLRSLRKLKSSTKKLRSTTKGYMMFNNKKLFSNNKL